MPFLQIPWNFVHLFIIYVLKKNFTFEFSYIYKSLICKTIISVIVIYVIFDTFDSNDKW